ncbi:MAG TPA: PaaX family transcriptional regulator C-terminal domain-containing protein [Aquabacterium sp.]|nr:PaaX family transcriptional regulator C-terminal domain-containing protein [Aquabacterium sp.]
MALSGSSPPTAKALIQSLLLAAEGQAYPSRQLVAAGALFGISENNIRVALVRLQAQDLAVAAGRGTYCLGPAGEHLGREISAWRQIEQRLGSWQVGRYIGVHTASMPRSDRTALQRRDRALQMMGFLEVSKGLHVRPDNLLGGVAAARQRLLALGLEPQAWVFAMDEVSEDLARQLDALWQGAALSEGYRQTHQQLRDWLAQLDRLDPAQAAREAYLLDRRAIRQVVWDPLLPDALVDAQARADFFSTVRDFDAAGRSIWWRFFEFSDNQSLPS